MVIFTEYQPSWLVVAFGWYGLILGAICIFLALQEGRFVNLKRVIKAVVVPTIWLGVVFGILTVCISVVGVALAIAGRKDDNVLYYAYLLGIPIVSFFVAFLVGSFGAFLLYIGGDELKLRVTRRT